MQIYMNRIADNGVDTLFFELAFQIALVEGPVLLETAPVITDSEFGALFVCSDTSARRCIVRDIVD